MERMRLFVRKGEYTVRKGQINISRGGVTYEYQLDKDMFVELNNKKVAVRYVDQDCIYLLMPGRMLRWEASTGSGMRMVPYATGRMRTQGS